MDQKQGKIDRRNFLKAIGAAGVGSLLTGTNLKADPNQPRTVEPNAQEKASKERFPQVPRRKLGKTGVEVARLPRG